ncbi:MAG TPA: membrane protein insertion efficiency factor YidD [Candidatus Omnitrophota bacterium]|nr:membrane protein insertion efficiency factor YidD [Candidatus Omnitrophota bacterium]
MKKLMIGCIRGYKKFVSPYNIMCCKFVPTCSEYAVQAIDKYGIIRGGIRAAWRICRCNPFSKGGYDPVK